VTAALHRETRTIPIVFVIAADPVGDGFIESLAHPGGNITGFINAEAAMGGKWLELLKEAAPQVRRAAPMFSPDTAAGGGNYFRPFFETAGSRSCVCRHGEERLVRRSSTSEGGSDEASNPFFLCAATWIASRSLSSGGGLRRPGGSQ
jgi:hypothetical protein